MVRTFSMLLLLTLFLNANCQDIAKKLQEEVWFVTGDLLNNEKCIFNSEKPLSEASEVKLLPDGIIKMHTVENFFLSSSYEIKKDMIKIYYSVNYPKEKTQEEVAHYYQIKELSNQKGFELMPIGSAAFN
jgi:hypothetical protein